MAEEQGYQVVDKRRLNPDGTPRESEETGSPESETGSGGSAAAGTAAESPGGSAAGAESRGSEASDAEAGRAGAAGGREALPPITARELVGIYVGQLQELAWSRMGLTPNPTSGTIEKDLADARFAIDCIADLVGRLDPLVDPTTRRELQTMLSNLRLNFVQQSGKT